MKTHINPAAILIVVVTVLAAVSTKAHTALIVEQLRISTLARNDIIDFKEHSIPNSPPYLISSATSFHEDEASALQTQSGFFQCLALRENMSGEATAATSFRLVVGTDTADTPLVLSFEFLGASATGRTYYNSGNAAITVTQTISGGIGAPDFRPEPTWGFYEGVAILASDGWQRRLPTTYDTYGIGLPVVTDSGPVNHGFSDSRTLSLAAFHGEINFGLLQPGEHFVLEYLSGASVDGSYIYPGPDNYALASLVDPFSLGGEPPPQVSMQGLTLPVPEPSTALLLAASLLALGSRRGTRNRDEAI